MGYFSQLNLIVMQSFQLVHVDVSCSNHQVQLPPLRPQRPAEFHKTVLIELDELFVTWIHSVDPITVIGTNYLPKAELLLIKPIQQLQ